MFKRQRPYQDKNLLSDAELNSRVLVMGPLGLSGYHPYTSILYFLVNRSDRPRFYNAIRGQSLEKPPFFGLQRVGRLGTLDAFWKEPMAGAIAAAMQFIPAQQHLIITHMVVKPTWQRMGINSRLVDNLQQRYPGRQLIFDKPTQDGQKFINSAR
jgi:hypothetical protein